ncbi:MAG TPA: fibronectin type III domain-containing protein [Chthoniobacteraceae bacterium]|jgi:hypothetical protein|nr:fibronectin type III domain-containing protein [Chthoniobacteraceae bacterium]
MSILKLELRKKDVNEKLGLGTTHIAKMTGNADYPAGTRVPTDADFAALQAALQAAVDARAAAAATLTQKDLLVDAAEANWDVGYTARGTNCEAITPGNAAALAGAGFALRGEPVSVGPVTAPANVRATMGDMAGEVDLMWEPQKGASTYLIFYKEHLATGDWIQATATQKSKATVEGLTSGKTYAFRIQPVGKDGPGPLSDEVVKMAP